MSIRHSYNVIGAAVLSCATIAFAQTNDQATTSTVGQIDEVQATPITLVGCLQREADYRRQHDSGRGGVLATGAGLGNEYVLINASRAGSTGTPAAVDCATASTGDAYELTGKSERELEPFVGRLVEITGMRKKADIESEAVGASGTTAAKPTGGFDPLGQDLKLFEVEVTSFREAAMPQAQAAAQPSAEPVETEPQAISTSGQAEGEQQLPRTASPVPLTGLLGLLSLAGALGFRTLRRR
jgi:hypothetical protein